MNRKESYVFMSSKHLQLGRKFWRSIFWHGQTTDIALEYRWARLVWASVYELCFDDIYSVKMI